MEHGRRVGEWIRGKLTATFFQKDARTLLFLARVDTVNVGSVVATGTAGIVYSGQSSDGPVVVKVLKDGKSASTCRELEVLAPVHLANKCWTFSVVYAFSIADANRSVVRFGTA